MTLAALAFRNLLRNRRRTLFSLCVVAAGSAALLLTAGFVRFSFDGLREAIVHGGLGHLEVAPVATMGGGSAEERATLPGFRDWESVRAVIEEEPHVAAAMGVTHLTGLLSRDERSVAAMVLAVEPERERRMGFVVHIRAGANLPDDAPAPGEEGALIGQGLAKTLYAGLGDVVTLMAVTGDGTLNALDLSVTGTFTTGLQDLDARLVKIHRATAARLAGSDNVSTLIVALDDHARTDVAREALVGRLAGWNPPLAVLDWKARAPFYGQVLALYSGIFAFLGTIVFVLVCLSTSNTLLMTVLERMRELGTLRALGTSVGQVAALILLEALWLGLIGGALGGALGACAGILINAAGIQMPPPPGAANPLDLRLLFRPSDFALVALLMSVMLVLSAVPPSWRAGRIRIAEALAHV